MLVLNYSSVEDNLERAFCSSLAKTSGMLMGSSLGGRNHKGLISFLVSAISHGFQKLSGIFFPIKINKNKNKKQPKNKIKLEQEQQQKSKTKFLGLRR